ncbi:TonB-dependent siderophore receptor [Phyllobacterium sp. YR531]|uniref:TonB-dependent siderophore receptor n=1 Tax=Phyllobacterium sp. YR531 TaxID=1144343 RepID=UPI0002F396F6|nr:TonB-dependent siderophore receptor [Phyllobacterium sp. YR531]
MYRLCSVLLVSPIALSAGSPALAQQQSAGQISYSIPATSLGRALTLFGDRSNIQVLYAADLTRGRNSPGLSGSFAKETALSKLLAGTGLSYRFTNANTVTLVETTASTAAAPSSEGSILLDPITIKSRIESAWGPVDGYVASRSAAGTKTDTPIIETPQSISVIARDQMDKQNVESLNGVLRYTPGASGDLYGTDNRGLGVQLRGISNANGVFYRDGLQLKESNYALFTGLDPYGAERYEILRGPASVLYGQNSPGGLINYVSKRPTDERISEVSFGVGNFNRYEGKFDFGGKIAPDSDLSYRLVGLVRQGDTQIDFVDDDRIFIAPSISWKPDEDTSLTVLANYQRDRSGWAMQYLPAKGTVFPGPGGKKLPSSMFVGEPDFDTYNNTQASIGYEFEHRFNETWKIKQNARYVWLKHYEEGVFGGGLREDGHTYDRYADAGGSKNQGVTIDTQAQANFDTGKLDHTLLIGVDFTRYSYNDYGAEGSVDPIDDIFNPKYGKTIGELVPYQDTDTLQRQVGIYVQDQIAFDKWRLTLGGRHDWSNNTVEDPFEGNYKQKETAFTGRAGLVYLADNGLAPYAAYSESFQPIPGIDSNGNVFVPETGKQYEIGIKYQPDGWNSFITLSAFDLTRGNVPRYGGVGRPDDVTQTGEIRSRGIELEGVASLDSGIDLRLAYTYLDTEISKATSIDDAANNEGNTPFGVPTHSASLWANYKVQSGVLEGLGLGAGVRYVGSTYGDDANSFKVPAVTLVDAAVSYNWKNVELQINASNLFDKTYVASCFAESFGCFYGEGRRVTGSVKYSW